MFRAKARDTEPAWDWWPERRCDVLPLTLSEHHCLATSGRTVLVGSSARWATTKFTWRPPLQQVTTRASPLASTNTRVIPFFFTHATPCMSQDERHHLHFIRHQPRTPPPKPGRCCKVRKIRHLSASTPSCPIFTLSFYG